MAFKLNNPPYKVETTPIYHIDMEDDVMGKANNNGTIIVNKDLDPKQIDERSEERRVGKECRSRWSREH